MRALVVYESMFGNTRDIAQAVADGIRTVMPTDLVEVSAAPTTIPGDMALLVIGAPTHGHGLSTPDSRADSARRAGERLVSRGTGVREWLAAVQPPASVEVALFDTRIKGPGLLWGSAAKAAAKSMTAHGWREPARTEHFLVGGPTGPLFERLVEGEIERASAWGAGIATDLPVAVAAG